MAISDTIQTLSAAFSLGILLQAAITALLLYLKGHETKLSQDRRRLVLVVFLLFAALWAQFDFLSLLIPTSNTDGCRATTIISSLFDQIARAAIGAYLLFSIGRGAKSAVEKYVLGGLVGIRVVIGVVFSVLTKPQFAPLCVAQSSSTPVAIIPIALDTIIIGVLAIRLLQIGSMQNGNSQYGQYQSKALTFVTIGFTIWTATSVPMELGLPYIILLLRTAIPATGLTILTNMLTLFPAALISSQGEDDLTSEAQSPFRPDPPRGLGAAWNSSSERSGSPVVQAGYGKNGRLFVTNPSDTPRDSPTGPFYAIKGEDKSKEANVRIAELRNFGAESSGASAVVAPNTAIALGSGVSITPVRAPSDQQKKSLFGRSKPAPRPNVRALGISHPVMDEATANNPEAPFARMQTIDLETAAAIEKNRRDNAATRALQNPRSAPMPPPADEGLRRSISTKRKEVPSTKHEPMPSISSTSSGTTISTDISTNEAHASSTSASLSPNRDEVRRRSPRHATLEEKQTYPRPPQLQKKLTIGLPSGPRSPLMPMKQQVFTPKAETVMLLNDIVYDNPAQVNSLMNLAGASPGAPIRKTKDIERDFRDSDTLPAEVLPDYNNTMSTIRSVDSKKNESIMERPRPYKKDRVKSRGLFPSDFSEESGFNRRRSKSMSSLTIMKATVISNLGSPTNMPALPPPRLPPTSAANLAKLLPKTTVGMTADEKISLLFPAPPGGRALSKRRSSVPSILSMIVDDTRPMTPPGRPLAARSDKAPSVTDFPESPIENRETFRFSANTYQQIAKIREDEGEIPALPASTYTRTTLWPKYPAEKSSEYKSATNTTIPSIPSSTTEQPVPIVTPKAATILRKPLDSEYEDEIPVSPTEFDDDEDSIMLDIMLDSQEAASEDEKESFLLEDDESEDEKESFLLEDDGSEDEVEQEIETPTEEDNTPAATKNFPWHRRVGDELPTFSDRGDRSRPRAMPPPPPLLLNSAGRKVAVVVRATEPDPVDSPSRAIAEIQAQLKRFEERDRASVGSLLRKFPADGSIGKNGGPPDDGRNALLENLEKEMGLQENAWQTMQHNYDRDSTGSMLTPTTMPEDQVKPTLSREPSDASSHSFRSTSTASGSVERMSRMRRESTRNVSPELTRDRATVWQQRLAQAHDEYTEKAPELQRKGSINFLSTKPAPAVQQSRSPNLTKSEAELSEDSSLEDQIVEPPSVLKTTQMWQPTSVPRQTDSLMWAPPAISSERSITPEPPALSLRPTQRRDLGSLSHSSSSLWMKPANSGLSATRPIVGLWGSSTARPKSIRTRPVTQKPPRKSKRITFLPDIVESPSPLPHKRETLGLYQFPWGEKSDSAVYRPEIPSTVMMAQPVGNPILEDRARELELEEYSSSFFDDYDDEDFDHDDEDEEIESDDDFDESTLWEIASLLKSSDGMPSKNSLLPQSRDIMDEYNYEEEYEDGPEYVEYQPELEQASLPAPQRSSLWIGDEKSNAYIKATGLAQPTTPECEYYIPPSEETVRTKPQTGVALPSLVSKQMWESEPSETPRHTYCLWNPDSEIEEASAAIQSEPPSPADIQSEPHSLADIQIEPPSPVEEVVQYAPLPSTVFVQPAMWKRPKTPESEPENSNLFEPDNRRSVFKTTLASPVAKDVRKQRASTLNVPSLESTDMWAAPKAAGEKHVSWIEKSAVAPVAVAPVVVAAASSIGMWTAPNQPQAVSPIGLFSPGNIGARTSEKEPAALGMLSKPRKTQASLPQLITRRLWRSDNLKMIQRDWISESSIRPTSPSIFSLSSGAPSPASDRSSMHSVASTSTKASSVWSTLSAASAAAVSAKPGWGPPKRKPSPMPSMPEKKDEEEQKDEFVSKLPVRQNSQKLPTPVVRRESKVLANAAMFESRAQDEKIAARITRTNSRGSLFAKKYTPPPSKPAYVPLRQQFRPVFIANWDAALQEAIAAGSQKKEKKSAASGLVRRKIPSAEWDAALETAVAVGTPKTARPSITRKRTSPAEWDSALATAISEGKPRFVRSKSTPGDWEMALGQAISQGQPRLQRPKATDAMWSAALMEATGQTSASTSYLWAPSAAQSVVAVSSSALMWSKSIQPKVEYKNVFGDTLSHSVRRPKSSTSAPLPELTSTSFWQPSKITGSTPRDWIQARQITVTMPVEPVTLAPSRPEATTMYRGLSLWNSNDMITKSEDSSREEPMWTQRPPVSSDKSSSRDIFSDVMSIQTVRKSLSRKQSLPKLKSKHLFEPSNDKHLSDVHWLYVSSKTLHTPMIATMPSNRSSFNFGFDAQASETVPSNRSSFNFGFDAQASKQVDAVDESPFASSGTWTAPARRDGEASEEERGASMWTIPRFGSYGQRRSLFSEAVMESADVKRPKSTRPAAELPTLESDNTWQASESQAAGEINWIMASAPIQSQTPTPIPSAPRSSASTPSPSSTPSSPFPTSSSSSSTWTPPTTTSSTPATNATTWHPSSHTAPPRFSNPHTEPWIRPRRRIETVTQLQSFELWRPWGMSEGGRARQRNWLVERSERVEFRW